MAAAGLSFRRLAGATTVAAVAGLSLLGASPAVAATDADCTVGNTLDANAGKTAADIQLAMDADAPLICISGAFVLTSPLTFDHELTLHGLAAAVLDGNNVTQIIEGTDLGIFTVENIHFTKASSTYAGGAIIGDSVVIRNSTFDHNVAPSAGAVFANTVTIEGSTFADNSATGLAGAVLGYSQLSVTDSTFSRNSADFGGAIVSYGVASVTGSTFDSNVGHESAGAFYGNEVNIGNSTFVGNHADGLDGEGGAIGSNKATIEQSTFLGNYVTSGIGHSLFVFESSSLRGNIFAGALPDPQVGPTATATDLGGNLFTTGSEDALVAADPSSRFGLTTAAIFGTAVLADNGGPTRTVAISPSGPAVNAVPAGGVLTTDQRGIALNGLRDAGAFEIAAPAPAAVAAPTLAATGSDPGWLAALAAFVLAVGLGAHRLSVRRSRS